MHPLFSYGAGFIFTTALPPDKAAAAIASIEILKSKEGYNLRKRHQQVVANVKNQLLRRGFPVEYAPSHIIPVSVSIGPAIFLSIYIRYGAGLNKASLTFRNHNGGKARRRASAAPQATRGKPSSI